MTHSPTHPHPIRLVTAAVAVAVAVLAGAACTYGGTPTGNPTPNECAAVRHAVATRAPADYIGGAGELGYWMLHDAQTIAPSPHEDTCWQSPYCTPTDGASVDAWHTERGQLTCPVPHPYLKD